MQGVVIKLVTSVLQLMKGLCIYALTLVEGIRVAAVGTAYKGRVTWAEPVHGVGRRLQVRANDTILRAERIANRVAGDAAEDFVEGEGVGHALVVGDLWRPCARVSSTVLK